jgi:hypothetical protein
MTIRRPSLPNQAELQREQLQRGHAKAEDDHPLQAYEHHQ